MKDKKIVMCDKCICKSCINTCDCESCRTIHGGYVGYCVEHKKIEQINLNLKSVTTVVD